MYLLQSKVGYDGQRQLWRMVIDGRLILHDLTQEEIHRSSELMAKYRDRPMDLADATLVVAAESLGLSQVFTLDSDFHIYRMANGKSLQVVP